MAGEEAKGPVVPLDHRDPRSLRPGVSIDRSYSIVKTPPIIEVVKGAINKRKLVKMYLNEGPRFSPSEQQNLAALASWFCLQSQRYKKAVMESPSGLGKAAKARHKSGVSLHGGLERPYVKPEGVPAWKPREAMCEGETWIALENPRCWRCQSHGTPAKESLYMWDQAREKSALQSAKLKGVGDLESILTSDMEFAQLVFGLAFL
ncbi:hypothetical protein STEG23_019431 [Scotinomys teguina]